MNARELQEALRQSFERFDGSQQDLAECIGVDRSAISRAIRIAGLRHASVQARIVSCEHSVPVQRRSSYEGSSVRHEWIIAS
jgi:hypothetical protein